MSIANPQQLNNADRIAVRPNLVPRVTAIVAGQRDWIEGMRSAATRPSGATKP